MSAQLELLIRARDQASAVLGDIDKKGTGLGHTLGRIGQIAGGIVLGAGLVKGPEIIGGLISTARDLELQMKKANTVFGDQIAVVRDWAAGNASAMGLTENQATNLAAGLADLLIPMGFSRDLAAEMSTKTIGLAGALAEWSGGQVGAAAAADILSKAYLGERDGLKALGISISEADVSARLAAKGQKDLTGAALDQAKALATQELIFEKSTDAQNAFAAGADSAARKQAEMKAKMAEAKETLANALAPAITRITTLLATLAVPAFEALGKGIAAVQRVARELEPVLQEVGRVFEQTILPFLSKKEVILAIAGAIGGGLVAAFGAWAVSAASAAAASIAAAGGLGAIAAAALPITALVVGLAALGAGIVLLEKETGFFSETLLPALKDGFEKVLAVVWPLAQDALTTLKQGWEDLRPAVMTVARFLEENVVPILEKVGQFLLDHSAIIMAAAAVILLLTNPWLAVVAAIAIVLAKWDEIKAVLTVDIPAAIDGVLTKVREIPVIGEIFEGAFNAVRLIVETQFGIVKNFVETTIEAIVNFVQFWIAIFKGDWDRAWTEAKELVTGIWNGIKEHIEIVLGALVALFTLQAGTIIGIFGDAWTLIKDGAEAFFNEVLLPFVRSLPGLILATLAALPTLLLEAGKGAIRALRDGIEAGFGLVVGILGVIPDLQRQIVSKLQEIPGEALDAGAAVIRALANGIRSGVGYLAGIIKDFVIEQLNPMNWDIPLLSPFSEAFRHAGQMIVGQLRDGIQDGLPALEAAMAQARDIIVTAVGQARDGVEQAMGQARDAIVETMGQARDALDGVFGQSRDGAPSGGGGGGGPRAPADQPGGPTPPPGPISTSGTIAALLNGGQEAELAALMGYARFLADPNRPGGHFGVTGFAGEWERIKEQFTLGWAAFMLNTRAQSFGARNLADYLAELGPFTEAGMIGAHPGFGGLIEKLRSVGLAFARGFHGFIDRPTFFVAGERGRERVDISPGGGNGGITLNGPLINVEGTLIANDHDLDRWLDHALVRIQNKLRTSGNVGLAF